MPNDHPAMPARSEVDPQFDGHVERQLLELDPAERLDWIWAAMQLLRIARGATSPGAPEVAEGSVRGTSTPG